MSVIGWRALDNASGAAELIGEGESPVGAGDIERSRAGGVTEGSPVPVIAGRPGFERLALAREGCISALPFPLCGADKCDGCFSHTMLRDGVT